MFSGMKLLCGALLVCMLSQAWAHGGVDHSMEKSSGIADEMHMAGGMGDEQMGGGGDGPMEMGGAGSTNMTDACYSDPSAADCVTFIRSDDDWEADVEVLCDAMPFMIGCSLWQQCQNGTASGEFCELSSLAGDICVDMPGMKGCEAWLALCAANSTVVEQCSLPGPIPGVVTTFAAKEGIESLCSTHCMDGCGDCEMGKSYSTCTDPLLILANMCYMMPTMPECQEMTGIVTMCENEVVAANFPLVCTDPPAPTAKC